MDRAAAHNIALHIEALAQRSFMGFSEIRGDYWGPYYEGLLLFGAYIEGPSFSMG